MIDSATAGALVRSHFHHLFGDEFDIIALPGERDANFRVSSERLTAVLKVCQPGEGDHLRLQDRVLRSVNLPTIPRILHDGEQVSPTGDILRLVSWIEGEPWVDVPIDPVRRQALGAAVATVDHGLGAIPLESADEQILQRPFRWNMMQAPSLADDLNLVDDAELRELCRHELTTFTGEILPRLETLPQHLIHNDANERNIIVADDSLGLIDFGDLVIGPRVIGLATAIAYAATTMDDPVRESTPIVTGYHRVVCLSPEELSLLWPLVRMRLVMSVINAAAQSAHDPSNDYLLISQDVVPRTLRALAEADDFLALCRVREACGYEPSPRAHEIRHHLRTTRAVSVVDVGEGPIEWLNWSAGSDDPRDEAGVSQLIADRSLTLLAGRYAEDRDVYIGEVFTDPLRTIHLGVDLFKPQGAAVFAPYDGIVEDVRSMPGHGNYGHAVLLRHSTAAGTPFWTLYGHLSSKGLPALHATVVAGEVIATMGASDVNGGWPPHVHVQILTDLCGRGIEIYGVAPREESTLWRSICPNPNLMLGIPPTTTMSSDAHAGLPSQDLARQRSVRLSPNLSLNFREPLHIVRGEAAYLYDAEQNPYLDLVNNVAHVGHGHPHVVAAGSRQMHDLNTNTRYLHDAIVEYARNLTATLPDPLTVVFFVNSGSEANDLAIRLARAHTQARGWISLRHAYHGHTASVVDISPYKFLGKGGEGAPPHVRVAELPDAFRGCYTGPHAGAAYARDFSSVIDDLRQPLAAFIAEGIVSTAGQVTLAEGFLPLAYEQTRSAGGVCIADEVQIGMGRVGEHFWGFELHGVVPDIVTMGKPMGNGHPLAAVVTTPEIAASFHNGMEYFNTFGGNPVSATIGQAVLDVVTDSRLQLHAHELGEYVQEQIRGMRDRHPLIGDVRGHGLFLGIELMRGDQPAGAEVADVIEFAKRRGVLLSSDGPDHNVFKIKPPMVVQRQDMDVFLEVFDDALAHIEQGDRRV